MKKFILFILTALSIFFVASCNSSKNIADRSLAKPKYKQVESSEVETSGYASLINSITHFAAKLAEETFVENSNYAVSPLSIYMALSLACEASSGETREELLNVLGLDYETLKTNLNILTNVLNITKESNRGDVKAKISLTNSIWFNNSLNAVEETLKSLAKYYKCYSFDVDFKDDNKNANWLIRQFVRQQTNGLIDQNFNISNDTLYTFINTLYIKDIWNDLGDELSFAGKYKFTNSDGSTKEIKLLNGYYNHGKTNNTPLYSSFYTTTDNLFTITFFKPTTTLSTVFNESTIYELLCQKYTIKDDILKEHYYTDIYFPEFECGYNKDIKTELENMGIHLLFDSNKCDFKNLTDEFVFASGIIHTTKLKVDRKGIEGAAVTILPAAGAVGPDGYKKVYDTYFVDKAFGYVVSYNNIPLFIGSVNSL